MVEDSSLCLDALNGLPGPYVKYFEEQIGPEGIFRMLADFEDKGATAQCLIGLMDLKQHKPQDNISSDILGMQMFCGQCRGQIVCPQGDQSFGWDACFQPDGRTVPFSCMTKASKNDISHRARAFQQLLNYLTCATKEGK